MIGLLVVALLGLMALAPGAAARDRDRDGMADSWERKHRVFGAKADADRDGLTNRFEYRRRLHPRRRDTDRDRLRDGDELRYGWNPRRRDTDGDGIPDGLEGAGRVEASSPQELIIRLPNGKALGARIGEDTVMVCPPTDRDANGDDDDSEAGYDDSGGNSSGALEPSLVPNDDSEVEQEEAAADEPFEDRCLPFFRPGALVHEAAVRDGVFAHLELVGGR